MTKRIRVSSAAAEAGSSSSSTIQLRPRDASPPRRRSFRIVARGDGEPTSIRITRPVSARRSAVAGPIVAEQTSPIPVTAAPDQTSAPPVTNPPPSFTAVTFPVTGPSVTGQAGQRSESPSTPVSISSASTERTLSSGSEESDFSDVSELGLSSDSSSDVALVGEIPARNRFPTTAQSDRDYMESLRSFFHSQITPSVTLAANTQVVDQETFRQNPTGLLNRPQIIHFIKSHSGRVKCYVCDDRIRADQLRIDYRPYSRTAAVKHVHVGCVERNRQLYFPTRRDLISFAENEFPADEERRLVEELQRKLPREADVQHQVVRLFPVVARGDAHERELERRVHFQRVEAERSRYLETRQEMFRQLSSQMIGRGLFNDRFGGPPREHYRGVNPGILEALPRIQVPLALDDPDECNCVICLEPMEGGQTVIVLPCFHRFHEKCIGQWFRNSKLCPIDKLDVEKLAHDGGHSQASPIHNQ